MLRADALRRGPEELWANLHPAENLLCSSHRTRTTQTRPPPACCGESLHEHLQFADLFLKMYFLKTRDHFRLLLFL